MQYLFLMIINFCHVEFQEFLWDFVDKVPVVLGSGLLTFLEHTIQSIVDISIH